MIARPFILLLITFSALTASAADGPTPYPDPKDEAAWPGKGPIRYFKWMPENRASFWAQREADRGAVVFVGDSLTMGWPPQLLKEAFPNHRVANRGVGGDTSRGLLFRFQEDVLDLQPRAIFLMIGFNDIGAHGSPADSVENIAALLDLAKAHAPQTPVVLFKGPPSDYPDYPLLPGAREDYNRRLDALAAARPEIVYVDLYSVMSTSDGKPIPEYVGKDRVHLVQAGYQKWLEVLKPVVAKMGLD